MVKGVNKQIIEVNNPDSIYFEKAVFYLRTGITALPDDVARREAERYISSLGLYQNSRKKYKKRKIFLIFSAVAVVLCALIFLKI